MEFSFFEVNISYMTIKRKSSLNQTNSISMGNKFQWIFNSLAVVSFLCVILFGVFNFTKKDNLVYVDTVKLLSGYKGMEKAKSELTTRSESYQANLDTLRSEFEKAVNKYQASKDASANEKQLMEDLVKSKQQEYLNYEQIVGEQVKKQDQELSTKLLEKVNDYIKRYGEEKGYQIILAATPYGNIAYGAEVTDITGDILEGLNKEYSK